MVTKHFQKGRTAACVIKMAQFAKSAKIQKRKLLASSQKTEDKAR